jgi:hypothetical protein
VLVINYRDEAVVEEEADETGGNAAVRRHLLVHDVPDDVLGRGARVAVGPHLQAVGDQRVHGGGPDHRQQRNKEQQRPDEPLHS